MTCGRRLDYKKREMTLFKKKKLHMSKFYLPFFEQLFKMTRLDLRRRRRRKKSERMYSMCETSYNQSGNCTIK